MTTTFSTTSTLTAFLTAALLISVARVTEAQPSCAAGLVPCANYLNSTNPPATCCDSLRQVVTTQLPCLCNLYNTPGLLAQFNINVTQALELPRHCNITGDVTACNAVSPGSSPPATPGGGNSGNGVGSITWTAMPALLLVWAITSIY